jgi:lysophospholipase L1-like esterase
MLNRAVTCSILAFGLLTNVVACGSSNDGVVSGTTPTTPDNSDPQGSQPVDGGSGTDAGTRTSPGANATIPKPSACPTAKYKTVVVIGDSISDVGNAGGEGQEPFYRTLLVANDDTKYPEWKGFDLATCWGLNATTNVVKASKGGAVATVPTNNDGTSKRVLLNQVTGLPATLEGPVLVVGTIGGNDAQSGLISLLTGSAAQQQKNIDDFASGFGKAMADLTKADRFGPGVKVSVLMTNIYDPSGGTGHFYYEPAKAKCPGALGLWPDNKNTGDALTQWNTSMAAEAAKYTDVHLLSMRAPFDSHTVSSAPDTNWFYKDCIHPNAAGHHAVRGIFWAGMVALP